MRRRKQIMDNLSEIEFYLDNIYDIGEKNLGEFEFMELKVFYDGITTAIVEIKEELYND